MINMANKLNIIHSHLLNNMNVEYSYEYFQHSTQYASNMCHIHMNKAHSTHIHIYHR